MKFTKAIITCVLLTTIANVATAQERKVENRPYTDLRTFHFGVTIGTNLQDVELNNVGPLMLYDAENNPLVTDADGNAAPSIVSADQDSWDPGFHVGVLGELRLNAHLAFRMAPTLYFGNRHLIFRNYSKLTDYGAPTEERQNLKSVYIAGVMDLIISAQRFNNHRPYFVTGITPMINLSSRDNDYLRLKQYDVYASFGFGCDFYLPFFKLRPELKFMYSLTNALDKGHVDRLKDTSMMPYARAVDKARTKMICLSLYFE